MLLDTILRKYSLPFQETHPRGSGQDKDHRAINLHGYCLHHQTDIIH